MNSIHVLSPLSLSCSLRPAIWVARMPATYKEGANQKGRNIDTEAKVFSDLLLRKKSLTPSTGLVTAHIILGQTMQLSNFDILHHGMQVMFLIKDTQEPQRPMTMPKQTSDSSQKLRQQRNNPMTAAIIRQTEVTLGTMGPGPFQPRALPWTSLPGALPFSPLENLL